MELKKYSTKHWDPGQEIPATEEEVAPANPRGDSKFGSAEGGDTVTGSMRPRVPLSCAYVTRPRSLRVVRVFSIHMSVKKPHS